MLLEDVFQWDVYNWSKANKLWDLSQVSDGKAAAFGEREGGLSLMLAKQGYSVICSDYNSFSEIPLELHKKYQIVDQIDYQQLDISAINLPDNTFDVVVFKSVIGALNSKERQWQAISELHRILKPGGQLLFAENLEASRLHTFARKKFTNWGHRWRYLKWDETADMLQQFSSYKASSIGFLATFGRSEKQRTFLGKIDNVLCKVIPKKMRYIQVVKATK